VKRALVAVLLAACGTLDPEVGSDRDADDGECVLEDSDPDADVSFDRLRTAVLTKRCSCHTANGGLGQVVTGLDLNTHEAALAGGRRSRAPGGPQAVAPGDPCASLVVQKTGPTPPFGFRMPLSGPPLTDEERQMIIDWIAEGALP
jgi:hypothetical protein